jgi:pyruvate,orthophosphate dikinase
MDTVLNLGMNDDVVEGLATKTNNPRFAWDSYRRFLEMFGNVVLDIPRSHFDDELDDLKYGKNVDEDSDLSTEDLKELVQRFKDVYKSMDMTFPQDVLKQLELASKYLPTQKTWLIVNSSIVILYMNKCDGILQIKMNVDHN